MGAMLNGGSRGWSARTWPRGWEQHPQHIAGSYAAELCRRPCCLLLSVLGGAGEVPRLEAVRANSLCLHTRYLL